MQIITESHQGILIQLLIKTNLNKKRAGLGTEWYIDNRAFGFVADDMVFPGNYRRNGHIKTVAFFTEQLFRSPCYHIGNLSDHVSNCIIYFRYLFV